MYRARSVHATTVTALETWAAQKRGCMWNPGQPIPSVLGRIRDERIAAGEGDFRLRQKWPEVYKGDGLLVQVAIATLRELPRLTLTFYYVLQWPWRVRVEDQARELGVPKREYWRELQIGEAAIDAALQVMHAADEWQSLAGMRRAA